MPVPVPESSGDEFMKRPKAKTPKTRKIRIRKAAAKAPEPKPFTMRAGVHPFRDISAL